MPTPAEDGLCKGTRSCLNISVPGPKEVPPCLSKATVLCWHSWKDSFNQSQESQVRAWNLNLRSGRARSAHPDGVLPALAHLNDSRSCGTVAPGRIGPDLPVRSGRDRHCII